MKLIGPAVFLVDSKDHDRFPEAKAELDALVCLYKPDEE
jgi:hypothetical protein